MKLIYIFLFLSSLVYAQWNEIQKLVPSGSDDGVTTALVAIDGDQAVLGDGNELFFYQQQEDGWSQIEHIKAPVGKVILQDEVAYVSRHDGVVVYVFDQGNWKLKQVIQYKDITIDSYFRGCFDASESTLALCRFKRTYVEQGNYNIYKSEIYIFDEIDNQWSESQIIEHTSEGFDDAHINIDKDTMVIVYNPGNSPVDIFIYTRENGYWKYLQQLDLNLSEKSSDDHYLSSVDIEGDTIALGFPHAAIQERMLGTEDNSLLPNNNGAVFIARRQLDGFWKIDQKLFLYDSDDSEYLTGDFGIDIAIDGSTLLIGDPNTCFNDGVICTEGDIGTVYFYKRTDNIWKQQQIITNSDNNEYNHFGTSVSLSNNVAMIGLREDQTNLSLPAIHGRGYIFTDSNLSEDVSVESDRIIHALSGKTFKLSGVFSPYDFEGVENAFDWVFKDSAGNISQLQGEEPTVDNVFGWKYVNVQLNDEVWYMFQLPNDVDGDGSNKYDWMIVSVNKPNQLYKLSGVMENGTFRYSEIIDIEYSIDSTKNEITFSNRVVSIDS